MPEQPRNERGRVVQGAGTGAVREGGGTRLLAFLGTGNYQETCYFFEGDDAPRQGYCSRFVARALAERFQVDEFVLLSTRKALGWKGDGQLLCNGMQLLLDLLRSGAPAFRGVPEPPEGASPERAWRDAETTSGGRLRWVEIPDSSTQEDLWALFERSLEALRAGRPRRVLLDITHGWRAQPFFAAGVVAYARALAQAEELLASGAPTLPELVVYYGSFDRERPENAIWDLTPLVDLLDWTRDLQLFLLSGDGRPLARRSRALASSLNRAWAARGQPAGERPTLGAFASALESYSQDFLAVRTPQLLLSRAIEQARPSPQALDRSPGSAARLYEVVRDELARSSAPNALGRQVPALAPALELLLRRVEPLLLHEPGTPPPYAERLEALRGNRGSGAVRHLARLYLDAGRFGSALTTLREGLVNRLLPPGSDLLDRGAREHTARRHLQGRRASGGSGGGALLGRLGEFLDLRNDIAHAGYRRPPRTGQKIAERAEHYWSSFREWLDTLAGTDDAERGSSAPDTSSPEGPGGAEGEPSAPAEQVPLPPDFEESWDGSEDLPEPEPAVFLNLSNHRLEDWSPEQRAAAEELCPGGVLDWPFPAVDPRADTAEVERMARDLAERLPDNVTHAMVQGEFTLTVALVRELQSRGVTCLAATTERKVRELPDGGRAYDFRFETFREYPSLLGAP